VSQPDDRKAKIDLPGKLDKSLKEFWTTNPWNIVKQGNNLSAYERNRMWLNVGGKQFLDVSYLSGADSDGDGRSVVAADFRNCGRMDLIVRQISGGAVHLYENQMPTKHYLTVSLRGTKSNKRGIGARLVAKVNGRQIVRELFPNNSYQSQMPALVYFGLGESATVDELAIRWPSSDDWQVLTSLKADRHVLITEGKQGPDAIEEVVPGKTMQP
jgi:hypothetical protein